MVPPRPGVAAPDALSTSLTRLAVVNCYQCGKCTAGCPVADRMDLGPNRILRLLQLGRIDTALEARALWQCVSCQTCSARCPQDVDCAAVIDQLREAAARRGVRAPGASRTVLFQQAFLENIRRNGRLNELELIAAFKTRAFLHDRALRLLFKDAALAPRLQARHKLHFFQRTVRDRALVKRIFERCVQ